jgi:polyisoprenoid-binding protein YceI
VPAPLLPFIFAVAISVGTALSVDPAQSVVRFHVSHQLHQVEGESRHIEGRALTRDDGTLIAMVRIPVTSFQSGDANRDEHMQETLEVGKFPFVILKGLAHLGPGSQLPSGPLVMEGQIEFHGVVRPVKVPLAVDFLSDGLFRVRGNFEVSLDSFGIERPSLLFIKIADTCQIEVDFMLRKEGR